MRLLLLLVVVSAAQHRQPRTIGVIFRGLVDAHTRTTPKPSKDSKAEKLRSPPPPTVYLIPVPERDRRAEAQLLLAAHALRQNATRNIQAMDKILEVPPTALESNQTAITRRNSSVLTEPKQFLIRIAGDEGKSIMIRITGDDVKVKKGIDNYMIGVNNQDAKANIKIHLPEKKETLYEQINPHYIPPNTNAIPRQKAKDPPEDQVAKDNGGSHVHHVPFALPFNAYPYGQYYSSPTFLPPPYPSVQAYPSVASFPVHPGLQYPPVQQPSKPQETQTQEPPKTHVQLTVRVKDETRQHDDSDSKEAQNPKKQKPHRNQDAESINPSAGYTYDKPPATGQDPRGYSHPNSVNYQDPNPQKFSQWYLQNQQQSAGAFSPQQYSAQQNYNYAQYNPYSPYLQPPQPHSAAAAAAAVAATQQPAQQNWNYAQYNNPYSAYFQSQQQQSSAYQQASSAQSSAPAQQGWNYAQYTPYPSYLQDTLAPPYLGYRFQRSTRKPTSSQSDDSCFLCSFFG